MTRSWNDWCLFISVMNDLGVKKGVWLFLQLFMELKALYIDLQQIVRNGSVYFQFQA